MPFRRSRSAPWLASLAVVAVVTASELATKQKEAALVLSQKVEETAKNLSQKVEDTAATLAVRVEETALQILANMQEDLKAVHKRLHALEGSVAHKEKEINERLDAHERPAPITAAVAAEILNPKGKSNG